MGEQEFTAEELEILGETPAEPAPEEGPENPEAPEGGEPQKPETEETPAEGGEEGADDVLDELLGSVDEEREEDGLDEPPEDGKVPYGRFAKVYGENKSLKEKFDLFKRDPEAYYKLYPDERPETAQQPPPSSVNLNDIDNLVVQGGDYDGMSLAQVRQQDPAAAAQMEAAYLRQNLPGIVSSQVQEALKATQQEKEQERYVQETQQEIDSFMSNRAQEFFKKPMDQLSLAENKKLEKLVDQCVKWGKENRRGSGVIEDIYFLMTKDRQIARAKAQGADALMDAATKGGKVRSIRAGGSGGGSSAGFDKLMDLSESQAAQAIEKMPDKDFSRLMKEGSSELRAKYPGWPWE